MESKLDREVAVCFVSYSSSFFLNAIWKLHMPLDIDPNAVCSTNLLKLWCHIWPKRHSHLHDGVDEKDDYADGIKRHEDAHGAAASTPSTVSLRLRWNSANIKLFYSLPLLANFYTTNLNSRPSHGRPHARYRARAELVLYRVLSDEGRDRNVWKWHSVKYAKLHYPLDFSHCQITDHDLIRA